MDIPPGFETDTRRAHQLEAERKQDPRAIVPLIQIYERMVRRLQPNKNPLFYGAIQNNLGNAYCALPTGDRAANFAQAIVCFQEALRFRTPKAAPLDYAATQNNLGTAYYQLQTGDRANNLKQAIACYQEALRFRTLESTPLEYALTQNNLGAAYLKLPTEDRGTSLSQAIACFQEALRFRTPESAPLDYAAIQTNLGTAYSELPTGDRATNLREAIKCYREALRFLTPQNAPSEYALAQTNLGIVYRELPTGDRTNNLQRAIACFQEALLFRSPERAPLEYASIQNSLGNAYRELPTGDHGANLERAIACFREALRFRSPRTEPFDYAQTQNNLGLVYRDLSIGDRAANLSQAIACFQEALRLLTQETEPFYHALAQINLGTAYRDLLTGDRGTNLERAITCFQEALRFLTPESSPLSFAYVQTSLGNAYRVLPTGNLADNLERAITCFQKASRFVKPQTEPYNYAVTRTSLGSAYMELPTGDRAANLSQAIACFQEALRVWTPESAPFEYATTKNSLGLAYRALPAGDRAANLSQAIACFEEALRFLTPETAPAECRMANRNLADLHFAQGEWQTALSAYHTSMDAGERLYRAGLSAESRKTEVAQNAALYRHAAFAAVRCGSTLEALLILEHGKTRLLAEALRLRVPHPANVPDEVWQAFERAGASVRAAQVEQPVQFGEEHDPIQTYTVRQMAARTANVALDAAIEQVRAYTPEFLKEIDLITIQTLLPDEHTILLAYCITEQGSICFAVGRHLDQDVRVIEVPTFTQSKLFHLFRGWLEAYVRYLTECTQATFDTWQQTIMNTLAALGQQLLTPTLTSLPADLERIIFLPSAELFLLPLHAVPLPGNDIDLVCDRYQVSYVPSIEVLANAHTRVAQGAIPELYAAINPQADPQLIFTSTEGAAIARLFTQGQIDEGRAGTKQRVIAMVHGRSYIHFSCHGSYDWNDPAESGLDLADSRLTLAEMQRGVADLSATRLVTLSACETGIVDVFQGSAEEYVGIPAGFLLAGVPCVVSSLWAVPDLSTALLMERFYRNHLKSGMDFAGALREAQVWVRNLQIGEVAQYAEQSYQQSRQKDKIELFRLKRYYRSQAEQNPALHPFEHPYYWSAFTLNGV